jgi:hypothetical protein
MGATPIFRVGAGWEAPTSRSSTLRPFHA